MSLSRKTMVWASGHQLQGGKYIIEQVLGQGGFGITYKVKHLVFNSHVVIKTPNESLKHDPEYPNYIKRFIDEGQRLEQLSQNQHPNIVRIRDLFHEGGTYCLVMDFVRGDSLFNLVQQRGALLPKEALEYITQIGGALKIVHQAGLVHRDAHPGNIMIQQDGKAVLIDFGIASETMPTTVSSKFFGNPGFAPHEQIRGDRKPYVDVYSLAASLYYAVTGKRPTESFNRKAYNMPLVPPIEHVPTISNTLNEAILKGMEVEPENRPQTMQEWLELLKEPLVSPPPPNPQFSNTTPSTPINKIQINKPQVNNNQQTPISLSRRKFIQTVGWVGAGLGVSVVAGKFITDASRQIVSSPSPVTKISTKSNLSLQSLNFETVTVDAKGNINNRRQLNAAHFAEDLGNGITLEMVQIPGGTFTMGSPEYDKRPQRQVTVPTFFMGRYQVTQAQYQEIIRNNPSSRIYPTPNPSVFEGANRPVESITWDEAVEFCQRLSQKTGRNYRLPSEAEWEYACRALTTTPFYFGETITPDLVNYNGTNNPFASAQQGVYREETTEVGKFPPNAFGLYDMHGNVWEWCQDNDNFSFQGYKDAPTDGSAWLSGDSSSKRLRGGSWQSDRTSCRSANLGRYARGARERIIGFRLVVVIA